MTTRQTLNLIRRYESRNITFIEVDRSWPIVWERAKGVHVWDADGRKYLDLTAAFGVAAAGHANPRVVRAGQRQMQTLLHTMGDVHPHALKAQLARELSRITFERWPGRSPESKVQRPKPGKTIFCNSGFEAVEAALKTARLATGRPRILVFEGAYHGLGYGALNATHRGHFRTPFENQLKRFGHFLPFPAAAASRWRTPRITTSTRDGRGLMAAATELFRKHRIGAVLVEPVQCRGGIHIPPDWFLPTLRTLCDHHGAILVLDEIYTGFGRTGKWFACEHTAVVPDIICLGKALTGGFPLSACVGRADLMDAAWPESSGEAIHTSTFLGHPVGCAMALTQIAEIRRRRLVQRSARLGKTLLRELNAVAADACRSVAKRGVGSPGASCGRTRSARALGLMAGLELRRPDGTPATSEALGIVKRLLHRGFILLPEGEHGNVISLTPPLTITEPEIKRVVRALARELGASESTRL